MLDRLDDYVFMEGEDADAEYCPNGDLDRIRINGGIMPLRDEEPDPTNTMNAKRVLRGEDIVFLAEAIAERCNFWTQANGAFIEWGGASNGHIFGLTTFSRKLKYDAGSSTDTPTPRGIASFLHGIFDLSSASDYQFLESPASVPSSVIAFEDTDNPKTLNEVLAMIFTGLSTADLTFDMDEDFPAFTRSTQLLRSRIEKLFSTLAKVNGLAVHSPVSIGTVSSGTLHRVDKSGPVDRYSPNEDFGYFAKNGQNGDDYYTMSYVNTWAREVGTLNLTQPTKRVDPDSVVFFLVTHWETSTFSSREGQVELRQFWTVSPMAVTDTSSDYVRAMASACGVQLRTLPAPTPENPERIQFRFSALSCHAVGIYTFGDRTKW